MTKDQLWAAYVAKNPTFGDPSNQITLTARGLKKLFDQTWEQATRQADTLHVLKHGPPPPAPPTMSDMERFVRMFGGGPN